jgi:NAD(P)-dependent dehydrogenase (short-subunit alcohol dehydrogenase family)
MPVGKPPAAEISSGPMNPATRHVLITGTSTGIGRACVLRLAKAGFSVLAGVRSEADGKSLEQAVGANARAIALDVTDASSIARATESIKQICGEDGLLALVNNAGISVHGPVEHVPMSEWRRQFDVNFFGQIALTQAMLPLLRIGVSRHGRARIVMMSSIAGRIAQPIIAPYNASKYALEAASDALRLEVRAQGIRVCLVEPGAIDTPIWAKAEANPGAFPPDHPARVLYAKAIDGVVKSARKSATTAIPADRVAQVVEKCLTKRHPRARYLVGTDAHIGAAAKRLLPTKVLDAGMAWALGM